MQYPDPMGNLIERALNATPAVHHVAIRVARCPACGAVPGSECHHGLAHATSEPGVAHTRRVMRYLLIGEAIADVTARDDVGDVLDLLAFARG